MYSTGAWYCWYSFPKIIIWLSKISHFNITCSTKNNLMNSEILFYLLQVNGVLFGLVHVGKWFYSYIYLIVLLFSIFSLTLESNFMTLEDEDFCQIQAASTVDSLTIPDPIICSEAKNMYKIILKDFYYIILNHICNYNHIYFSIIVCLLQH